LKLFEGGFESTFIISIISQILISVIIGIV